MNSYLKFRTFIVLGVIALFLAAIYPLTSRDFYRTFRESLLPGQLMEGEALVTAAEMRQKSQPGLLPSAALLDAADAGQSELKYMTTFSDVTDNSDVIAKLRKKSAGSIRLGLDLAGGVEFVLKLNPDYNALAADGISRSEAEEKLSQNFRRYRDLAMEALRKRLETQKIFEAEITPFGSRSLQLKAPLASQEEKDKLQRLIQMSNSLEFRLVHAESDALLQLGDASAIPPGYEVMTEESGRGVKTASSAPAPRYVVSRHPEMTGNGIDQAFVAKNPYGGIAIALRFNSEGAKTFAEVTGRNLHRQLAIVLDGKLYCAPVIQSAIVGGQAEITGKFSHEEAGNIADALACGSFPFKIGVESVYDTAPTLGADNVNNGIRAGLIALVLLAAFMIVYYHKAGVIAVVALGVNVVLILGAMAAFDATLTMPGIAGIILTLGMAVDANVLVFERMREETEAGKSATEVVRLGFQRAYSSVIDGNLTTLIVALVLMYFGTGAIKGFAVSLSIGILSSLFTALFMSRVIFDWVLKFRPTTRFSMLRFFSKPSIGFMKQAKLAVIISLSAILLSSALCLGKGRDMFGVDFTGGTLLSFRYDKNVPVSTLEKTLADIGVEGKVTYKRNASSADNRKLEILMRDSTDATAMQNRVRDLLNKTYPELALTDGQRTVVGGMVGWEMSKNALLSLILAFVGMIVYVAIRYELCYAAAGILALVHDVVIALGIFILAGREMSLPVVAGLLTIVGYSINDTIVIFDRIREEKHLHPERPFAEVVDESLNRTLSRTILTSLTTFLVVVVMFFLGGIAINDFMLVIGLGIIVGSYSSLYIASPLVVWYLKKKGSVK